MIEDNEGLPVYEEGNILKVISDYFQDLFTSQEGNRLSTVKAAIKPCITQEINTTLIEMPTAEEIKQACFSIHADKAPGSDGFSASFFQTHWETVGSNIVMEVLSFFSSANLQSNINNTHMTHSQNSKPTKDGGLSTNCSMHCFLQNHFQASF